jgi:hypothetical protein
MGKHIKRPFSYLAWFNAWKNGVRRVPSLPSDPIWDGPCPVEQGFDPLSRVSSSVKSGRKCGPDYQRIEGPPALTMLGDDILDS